MDADDNAGEGCRVGSGVTRDEVDDLARLIRELGDGDRDESLNVDESSENGDVGNTLLWNKAQQSGSSDLKL